MDEIITKEDGVPIGTESGEVIGRNDPDTSLEHYAHVESGVVDHVIVIDTQTIETTGGWYVDGVFKPINEWVKTSYNTSKGNHKLGGVALRKNYAGKGFSYDNVRNAFVPPKPFTSWVLDESSCTFEAPVPHPGNGEYTWNEGAGNWVPI